MYSLEVVTVCNGFPKVRELWDLLSQTHGEYVGTTMDVARTHSSVLYENYGDHLEKNNLIDIGADFAGGAIHYGDIPDLKFSRLDIIEVVLDLGDAENWLTPLLSDDRFLQARIYDSKYDKWENMEDLLSFKTIGRSYEGLPLKSNGLPFPIEQQIVDISNNPGRWSLKQGYIESVGSTMWLGDQFWQNTGASKQEVATCDWLQVDNMGKVLKIQVQDEPFDCAESKQGELQNRLRDLLYPNK